MTPRVSESNPADSYLFEENDVSGFGYSGPIRSREDDSSWGALQSAGERFSDSLLGIGYFVSRMAASKLPRVIASPQSTVRAGLARAAGGVISAIGAGYRVFQAGREDCEEGRYGLPEARKELILSLGAIGAGGLAGEAGYLCTVSAAALGAPALVTAGLTAATVIGAGYAAGYAREWLREYYEGRD